jgi:hypothetical protein
MTDIPHTWLRQKGTPEEFERARLERMAAASKLPFEKVAQKFAPRPFGALTDAWRSFVGRMGPGDELWAFSSPDETHRQKLGCQGFAIVRGGTIRDTLITLQT